MKKEEGAAFEKASAALNEASQQQSSGAQASETGDNNAASAAQEESGKALDRAQAALEKAANAREKNEALDAAAAAELARRQKDLAEAAGELAESMKKVSPEGAARTQSAQESMDSAQQKLQQQQSSDAVEQEDEAISRLKDAQEKVDEERGRYEDMQQEEQLFQLKAEVEKLIATEKEIISSTEKVKAAAEGGNVSRSGRRSLQETGVRQKAAADKLEEIRKPIAEEQDGGMVFTWLMERIGADMRSAVSDLERGRLSELTLNAENDALQGLDELRQTLEDEIEARKKMKQDENQEQQQPQKNPLVSLIAELLLVRRLQATVNNDQERFFARQPKLDGEVDPLDRVVLERLSKRQGEIRQRFEMLLEKLQAGGGDEPEGDGK